MVLISAKRPSKNRSMKSLLEPGDWRGRWVMNDLKGSSGLPQALDRKAHCIDCHDILWTGFTQEKSCNAAPSGTEIHNPRSPQDASARSSGSSICSSSQVQLC